MQNVIRRAHLPFSNSFLAGSGFKMRPHRSKKYLFLIAEIDIECNETSS